MSPWDLADSATRPTLRLFGLAASATPVPAHTVALFVEEVQSVCTKPFLPNDLRRALRADLALLLDHPDWRVKLSPELSERLQACRTIVAPHTPPIPRNAALPRSLHPLAYALRWLRTPTGCDLEVLRSAVDLASQGSFDTDVAQQLLQAVHYIDGDADPATLDALRLIPRAPANGFPR